MQAETTRYAIEIPYLGSIILTHELNGRIPGLKEFLPEDRPNSTIVFWSFRAMVGLGMLMLLLGVWGLWRRWRKRLFEASWFLRFAVMMGPSGLIAILAGWYTAEIGRQPWIVYGVMRTKDAVSNHSALALSTTLIVFIVMYTAVFGTGVSYMLKLAAKGPQQHDDGDRNHHQDGQSQRPSRPLSAAPDDIDPAIELPGENKET
jgi:cytochrome bd ubiquinol oxidase subunit I